MVKSKRNILLWFLKLSPLWGSWWGLLLVTFSAMAQKPVIHIEAEQCETIEFSVVDMPGDRYTWDIFTDSTVNYAFTKGDLDPVVYFENSMYEGSTVFVNGLDPGRYFVRVTVWDEVGCTNNLLLYKLDILEAKPEAMVIPDSTCFGDPVVLKIILTGKGPWDLKYTYGTEANFVNLVGITQPELTVVLPPLPVPGTDVWVMEVTDQCTVNSYPSEKGRVVIFPKPRNSQIYLKE